MTNHTPKQEQDSTVVDFATDFDHTDPVWVKDPYPIIEHLRTRCPVAHSERYGGLWMPVEHRVVGAIARDTENFTSRSVVVANTRPGPDELPAPIGIAPPITSDPPFHAVARRLLQPAFAPSAVASYEQFTKDLCEKLLDDLEGKTSFDASVDFAEHIPVAVIANMLGFPPEDGDIFRGFVFEVLEAVNLPQEEREARFAPIQEYFAARIEEHVEHPQDDLLSYLLTAELDGAPLPIEIVGGVSILLIVAGIDTTWSAIGSSLWHLATHKEDLARLVAHPELLDVAIEEFLRAYAPVTMARMVKEDIVYEGCPMKKDDWVLLSFPAANRDPEFFPDADEVLIDRAVNRHAAFGLGIHRCLGSNLARMEIKVALTAFLNRYKEFTLAAEPTWSQGQVRGPRTLPLHITAFRQ